MSEQDFKDMIAQLLMLDSFRLIFLLISIAAVVLIATLANGDVRPWLRKYPVKKIAWIALAVSAGYWFISVPFVGTYFESSLNLDFPQEISNDTSEGKYIRDHHHRLERLENELKETKEELSELREHYRDVINIVWYGVLFFTTTLVFKRNNKGPDKDVVELKLNE